MKAVLALNMWIPVQFEEASFEFFCFDGDGGVYGAAASHESPKLCVSASLRLLFSFFSQMQCKLLEIKGI